MPIARSCGVGKLRKRDNVWTPLRQNLNWMLKCNFTHHYRPAGYALGGLGHIRVLWQAVGWTRLTLFFVPPFSVSLSESIFTDCRLSHTKDTWKRLELVGHMYDFCKRSCISSVWVPSPHSALCETHAGTMVSISKRQKEVAHTKSRGAAAHSGMSGWLLPFFCHSFFVLYKGSGWPLGNEWAAAPLFFFWYFFVLRKPGYLHNLRIKTLFWAAMEEEYIGRNRWKTANYMKKISFVRVVNKHILP